MKCKLVDTKPDFHPVTLSITFESQDEIDCFYAIFNYIPIADWLLDEIRGNQNVSDDIRDLLEGKNINDALKWASLRNAMRKTFE